MIQTLIAAWNIISWVRREKKRMESESETYFTKARARAWRLDIEKVFWALEDGPKNGNFAKLPRYVKWFFSRTTIDKHVGTFGIALLKSKKLNEVDRKALNQPLYRMH